MDLNIDFSKIEKKYLYIGIAIIVFIIGLSVILGIILNSNNTKYGKLTTITSTDGKFSIQIPNNIKYRINTSQNNDFTLDLFSQKDAMYMYATTIEKKRELDLYEVAFDDKTSYFKNKENIRDDSGFIETKIANNKAFEYSLVYYDSKFDKDFYCNVLWVETDTHIYVFNFEVSNNNSDKYKDIFNNMKKSIVFY